MENQVDGKLKDTRSNKLIELSNKKQLKTNEKYIGKTLEVLIEEKDGEYMKGHTKNYMTVYVTDIDEKLENNIIKVNIEKCYNEEKLAKCNKNAMFL